MTIKETAEYFKEMTESFGAYELCPCHSDHMDMAEIALSALEKQIPKKPKVLKIHDISGYKYGECFCGEKIMDDEKYCSNCGQKIDWES